MDSQANPDKLSLTAAVGSPPCRKYRPPNPCRGRAVVPALLGRAPASASGAYWARGPSATRLSSNLSIWGSSRSRPPAWNWPIPRAGSRKTLLVSWPTTLACRRDVRADAGAGQSLARLGGRRGIAPRSPPRHSPATLGLIAALLASRLLASFLYGTSARDPWVFAGSILALALIASAASLLPALRSARINPMSAIRCD